VDDVKAKWRRPPKGAWVEGKDVYKLPTRGGVKEIFSFNEEHHIGDMIEWCVEREISGQFPEANESVALVASTKSDHPRELRITWPEGIRPIRVDIKEGARSTRDLKIRTRGRRACVVERVSGLQVGEQVEISWSW
jgi:hypothetical protein